MTSTLPPDPYKALGVSRDADASTIKSTYRKLVLKCHPDKVTDESLKQQKQEEFHKIQQAYELIGDEGKRATYDAECKLEQMRREKLSRSGSGPNVEVKTARYDVRTQAPAGASFTASGPHRYSTEERKSSSRPYDDERFYTYEAYPKHTTTSRSSRPERETSRTTRSSADRTRSDHKKTRDREERRERSGKFVSVESESSADEKARFEAAYKKNSAEEEARREAAEARRKAEDRRSYEEPRYDRQRKLSDQENEAVRHIHRTSRVEDSSRPSPGRTSSYRDARPEYYESSRSSRREPRSSDARRSSARPKERPSSSSGRDRKGIPEIVDWDDRREERRPLPTFKHSSSSPADLHVPRTVPQRSYTESSRDHRRTETSPTPVFRRSETMPTSHSSSSRRKETSSRPSTLRETGATESSSPEPAYATIPPPAQTATKKYYYTTPGGGVSLRPEDVGVANGHRTVLREPERHRTRSPSPLSRPPMGANRHIETPQYTTVTPKAVPPTLGRSSTFTTAPPRASDDRGRSSRPLYGEISPESSRRENRHQTSFSPDRVSYSRKIGPDDIRWAPTSRAAREERDYPPKPTLGRTATYVY